jgi:hypothetical protein
VCACRAVVDWLRKNHLRGLVTEKLLITKPAAISDPSLSKIASPVNGEHTYQNVARGSGAQQKPPVYTSMAMRAGNPTVLSLQSGGGGGDKYAEGDGDEWGFGGDDSETF